MEFAANYCQATSELLQAGQVQIDRFKCPPWPDLVATAQEEHPIYVHFSLRVGAGVGDAIDCDTGGSVDWKKIETLVAQTDTRHINLHLMPFVDDHPFIPIDSTEAVHIETLTECAIKDVRAVVERFGAERVIVENIPFFGDWGPLIAALPSFISRVIEETDCGLLLDLSHARLAARYLGISASEYVGVLPTDRIREIHITGVQHIDERWVELARQARVAEEVIQDLAGKVMDHLPMMKADWEFFAWAMEQIHTGVWARPWVVTFEYGGLTGFFKATTDKDILADQIPRLYALVTGT